MNDMTDKPATGVIVAKPPALLAGGQLAAIIPQSLEETFRLAAAMHKSGLAPSSLNTVEKVLVAIMGGAELGLPPFQAVQAFMVTNGRPTIWGDAMLAVVRSHGFRVREWMEGEGDDMTAWCEVIRPDTGEIIVRSFSVQDAKDAKLWEKRGSQGQDTPWITYKKRMLQMRARAFACRDAAPDVLRGFQMREEAEEYEVIRNERPEATSLRQRLEANTDQASEGFTVENVEPTAEEELAQAELPVTGETAPEVEAEVVEEETDRDREKVQPSADRVMVDEPRPTETAGAQTAESAPATSASATDASTDTAAATSGQSATAEPSTDGASEADLFPGDKPAVDADARLRELYVRHVTEAKDWPAINAAWINFSASHAYESVDTAEKSRLLKIALTRAATLAKADPTAPTPAREPSLFLLWVQSGVAKPERIDEVFKQLSQTEAYDRLTEGGKRAIAAAVKAARA